MDPMVTGNLAYLVLLLVGLVTFTFINRRQNIGQMGKALALWGVIFVTILVGVLLWNDLRGQIQPQQVVLNADAVSVPRASDGHFYLTLDVNGTPTRFVVDTGATAIVLTRADAEAAGIETDNLIYSGRASTANGTVETAPVRIETLALGETLDTGVRAVVNNGQMEESLLGMSYLNRFSRIEIADGQLLLER
ncbi:TIGR02281 family clan AA aspartic protease [Rhodobacterales bacterium HKCCE4037]|mgnify:CR=1 FL=1|nr:TIGR02281 family clan AA aspartic protease [Rhodobacterales bacterium HKCCE4037]